MAKFEENLDAKISEVLNEAKLSDELYQKYLQFVGALDALPQDQIATDKSSSDIHDQFGRIRPLSMWPTKTSRAKSEKVWLNYNQRLQLQQAAKEAGLGPEDPTDDPDFLGQLLDTCVRTSVSMGGLDKKTAFRHCSKQVKRFEHAVRTALADRGLTSKQVEEFTQDLLKGMANGKTVDMKDLSVEDRQFIQDLKDSLTYKPKSEGVVREDLDDKDVFKTDCSYYNCDSRPDSERFHQAHTAAHDQARKSPAVGKFSDAMAREMAKFGYYLADTGRPVTGGIPFDSRDWTLREDVEARPEPTIILPNMKILKRGDWIELGPLPTTKTSTPGAPLDDADEFGHDVDQFPMTPVEIVAIDLVPPRRRENAYPDQTQYRVRLSNYNLLSLPDKSGVRWHGRPKHKEPAWFQLWYGTYLDTYLEQFFEEGNLRVIDNIEQWYQAQPEK